MPSCLAGRRASPAVVDEVWRQGAAVIEKGMRVAWFSLEALTATVGRAMILLSVDRLTSRVIAHMFGSDVARRLRSTSDSKDYFVAELMLPDRLLDVLERND